MYRVNTFCFYNGEPTGTHPQKSRSQCLATLRQQLVEPGLRHRLLGIDRSEVRLPNCAGRTRLEITAKTSRRCLHLPGASCCRLKVETSRPRFSRGVEGPFTEDCRPTTGGAN